MDKMVEIVVDMVGIDDRFPYEERVRVTRATRSDDELAIPTLAPRQFFR